MPSRRGFIGTIIGGGLALPSNVGKIVEATPAEIEQVSGGKTMQAAIIMEEKILWVVDLTVTLRADSAIADLDVSFRGRFDPINNLRKKLLAIF